MQSIMWFGIYCKLIEILENVVRLLMSFFNTFLKKDYVAEWLRRFPAKELSFRCASSNLVVVEYLKIYIASLAQ